jgi:hypothetical protein
VRVAPLALYLVRTLEAPPFGRHLAPNGVLTSGDARLKLSREGLRVT